MRYEADEIRQCDCEACGAMIYPGEDYKSWTFKGAEYCFCTKVCFQDFVADFFIDELKDKHINTADENALVYGDIKCHEDR